NSPAEAQSGINFNIGLEEASSRTQYSTQDWLQIEWLLNDEISIFCSQTQHPTKITDKTNSGYLKDNNWATYTSAKYKVSELLDDPHEVELSDGSKKNITTKSKAHLKASSTDAKQALYWGKGYSEHTFYAGYGAGITIDPNTGKATCSYDPEQFLTYDSRTKTWINMAQAYMVSYKKTPPVENIDLHFKPIMTTVEIDITGPTKANEQIKTVEISIPGSQNVIYFAKDGQTRENEPLSDPTAYFDYNITGQSANGEITGNVVKRSISDDEKFMFNLATPQSISSSEPLKITAILPPIEIGSSSPITITVYSTEGSNTKTFSDAVAVSEKVVIRSKNSWSSSHSTAPSVVDLGLSVNWATCNLGATSETEYGDYYGWGCTVPYATSTIPNWTAYFNKLGKTGNSYSEGTCGGDNDPLKTYVNDGTSIAGTDWDAAHERLGGTWRMPTANEFAELGNDANCQWTEVKDGNGNRIGWRVT
ncbi:MAG: hypothetical protein HUJ98_13655, partial [Bacteroidaceae bacterium]|nr:hypothetical protein [Bacteroidaceae bacterium]MCF0187518.1 hypothetical protein [Bacteroidaceae bacterium]